MFFLIGSLSWQTQAGIPVVFSRLEDLKKISGDTFRIDSTFLPIGTELEFSGRLPKNCVEDFAFVAHQGSDSIEIGITLPPACQWSSLTETKQKELLKQKTVSVGSILQNLKYDYDHPQIYFLEVAQSPKTKKMMINRRPIGRYLDESNYGNWLNAPVKVYLENPPPFEVKLPSKNPRPEAADNIPEDWNTERLFRFYPSRYGFDSKKGLLDFKFGAGFLTQDMLATFLQASVPVSERNKIGVSYDFCHFNSAGSPRNGLNGPRNMNTNSFNCVQDHGFGAFISRNLDRSWTTSLEGYHGPQYAELAGNTDVGQRIYIRIVKKIGP